MLVAQFNLVFKSKQAGFVAFVECSVAQVSIFLNEFSSAASMSEQGRREITV